MPNSTPTTSTPQERRPRGGRTTTTGNGIAHVAPECNAPKTSPRDPTEPLVLTARDVALLLSISPRHVATLNSTGRLPRPIRFGRSVRWSAEELREWLAAGAPSRDRWEAMKGHG